MNDIHKLRVAVIFGGAGFIGRHFTEYLLGSNIVDKVLAVDIIFNDGVRGLQNTFSSERYEYVAADVREPIGIDFDNGRYSLEFIVNLAAVHREPGHRLSEYYDTNLQGADNVCRWAEEYSCDKIIFTSSIAPYGPTEKVKSEVNIPTPSTPYGGSKLAAEKIHEVWQARHQKHRKLVIVRPGVVFGAGEGGNVSRLIKAVINRYFFYMGNKNTRKAGIYVKELCNAMYWVLENSDEPVTTFNMSMNPGPTVKEYVDVICSTAGIQRSIPSVPYFLLYSLSFLIDPLSKLLNVNQPISPIRLRKLVKSNNIVPQRLSELGYQYKYTFSEAMQDWKVDCPSEWQ